VRSGQVRIGTTLQSAQMLTNRFGAASFYRLASAFHASSTRCSSRRPALPDDPNLDAFTQTVNVRVDSFGRVPKRFR
jgi:hypothetical protein